MNITQVGIDLAKSFFQVHAVDARGKVLLRKQFRRSQVVAYFAELAALELRDVELWPNGTGQALIRRGNTDAGGQGRVAYLSRETVKWLEIWLDHAKISEGPIFRRLIGRDEIGDALHPCSIAPIFKRVAQWIGMPARFITCPLVRARLYWTRYCVSKILRPQDGSTWALAKSCSRQAFQQALGTCSGHMRI